MTKIETDNEQAIRERLKRAGVPERFFASDEPSSTLDMVRWLISDRDSHKYATEIAQHNYKTLSEMHAEARRTLLDALRIPDEGQFVKHLVVKVVERLFEHEQATVKAWKATAGVPDAANVEQLHARIKELTAALDGAHEERDKSTREVRDVLRRTLARVTAGPQPMQLGPFALACEVEKRVASMADDKRKKPLPPLPESDPRMVRIGDKIVDTRTPEGALQQTEEVLRQALLDVEEATATVGTISHRLVAALSLPTRVPEQPKAGRWSPKLGQCALGLMGVAEAKLSKYASGELTWHERELLKAARETGSNPIRMDAAAQCMREDAERERQIRESAWRSAAPDPATLYAAWEEANRCLANPPPVPGARFRGGPRSGYAVDRLHDKLAEVRRYCQRAADEGRWVDECTGRNEEYRLREELRALVQAATTATAHQSPHKAAEGCPEG